MVRTLGFQPGDRSSILRGDEPQGECSSVVEHPVVGGGVGGSNPLILPRQELVVRIYLLFTERVSELLR